MKSYNKILTLSLVILLLLCLAPMPYGYFTFVRIVATIMFVMKALEYYKANKEALTITFGALAILFQPLFKIALGRTMWNVIDVIVAILLVVLFVIEKKKTDKPTFHYQPIVPDDQPEPVDNDIEFLLKGKLSPNELVFIANEEDKALTNYFEAHPEVLEGWGQMIGFHVIYLPLLIKKLMNKQVLKYRAPYLSDDDLAEISIGNDFMLQYLEDSSDRKKIKQGFIRTTDVHKGSNGDDKVTNRFYPLSSKTGEPLTDQLHKIGKQIAAEQDKSGRYLEGKSAEPDELSDFEDSEAIEDLIEEVRERIAKLRQRGIAEHILEQLIHPDNRLSRMIITKDWRIMLPDYNVMEIKMEPLSKAVYLLYLKHPEGIAFKHLAEYKNELSQIYNQLRPSGLTERAKQSIEDVTNPTNNSINEKCARIRAAFLSQFDDYMAKSYYIDGPRGEAKKISLPRNLVVWE